MWRPPRIKPNALPSLTASWGRGWTTERESTRGAHGNYPLFPAPLPSCIKGAVHQRGPKSILPHWTEFPLEAFSGVQILGGRHGVDSSKGAGPIHLAGHQQPDFPGLQSGPTGSYQQIGPPLGPGDGLLHCDRYLWGLLAFRHQPQDPHGLGRV